MIILIFIFGICVGSFLNVLIDRLPNEETILGRSHCDYCKKTLAWYDLIPLLSFLFLKGKCRYCHKKLSWQYPFIELLTGISFLFVYGQSSKMNFEINWVLLLIQFIIISNLIVIFFSDLKYRIIPDQMVIILMVIGALNMYIAHQPVIAHILSGVILSASFMILVLITRGKGMGMGDVKYAFVMGLLLGFPATVIGFYTAFLTGAFISLILILVGKKRFGQTIAFGPFLVAATFIAYYWGNILWILFGRLTGLGA